MPDLTPIAAPSDPGGKEALKPCWGHLVYPSVRTVNAHWRGSKDLLTLAYARMILNSFPVGLAQYSSRSSCSHGSAFRLWRTIVGRGRKVAQIMIESVRIDRLDALRFRRPVAVHVYIRANRPLG
jgi:hypothetical protein